MFDAMKLLGSMIQGQATPATAGRFDMAAQSMNYGQAAPQPQQASGGLGTMGAGALGALGGALLGNSGPGIVGGGLLAIVGNMAVQALQAHLAAGATPNAAPQAPAMGYAPATPDAQHKATLLIRAMIQAAKADGTVDPVEMQRITGKIQEHGHDPSAYAFVSSEMAKPIDLAGLCREVTSPQEAVEVYAASLMVLDVDSQAERDYLEDLAKNLGIAPPVVAQIHQQLGIA